MHVYQTLALSRPPELGNRLADAARDVAIQADSLERLDSAALPVILALLATGAFPAAARLIRQLAPTADPWALAAAAGRYAAWSGDLDALAPLRHHGLRLLDASSAAPPDGAAGTDAVIAAGALAAVERSATDLADPANAARAHAALRPLRNAIATGLPDERVRLLAAALGLDPGPGAASAAPGQAAQPNYAPEWIVLHVVHQLLGIDPDATRGRLRLRPDLHGPEGAETVPALPLRLDGLAFADGSVVFEVEHEEDGALVYSLEQDSGAIPTTALLEPLLPGRPRAADVDGRPAELRARQTFHGTVLPVQLVLDAPRQLRIWMNEGRPPK